MFSYRNLTPILIIGLLGGIACQETKPEPLVVMFCLDGATGALIDDLRSERRLPTLDRLIRSGTYGKLRSWAAKRILSDDRRRGYWSPIIWTTIATGKVPEKHGIRDFILPNPGTSTVWMGSETDPARAELRLPEIQGQGPFTLRLRMHSHASNGEQDVQLLMNDEPLDTIRVPIQWKEFYVPLPESCLRPARNRLELVFSKQTYLRDSPDKRRFAGELASLSVVDGQGRVVVTFDPVYQRYELERGFYRPRGEITETQSVHWRALPVWSLLDDLQHPVGIIGYWGTYPAYEVNGFLVSSRMGIESKRLTNRNRLTWPEELAVELEPLAPTDRDLETAYADLPIWDCGERLLDEHSVTKKILIQDEYYYRIARRLLPTMKRGLFSIYFRAIDVSSHAFLHWRHGADIPETCPESVRGIVDGVYVHLDRWMGDLLEMVPEHATVVVVSDHGMVPVDTAGYHTPFGVFVASGRGIRSGSSLSGASVLDVAPTLLQMFGSPVPLDMDGKILPQVFEARWLAENPPRYADIDTSSSSTEEALTEGREEILEQLRALGYIQ
jgi:predicted AlkP superfamily phosphohydrolase/phosphomutase